MGFKRWFPISIHSGLIYSHLAFCIHSLSIYFNTLQFCFTTYIQDLVTTCKTIFIYAIVIRETFHFNIEFCCDTLCCETLLLLKFENIKNIWQHHGIRLFFGCLSFMAVLHKVFLMVSSETWIFCSFRNLKRILVSKPYLTSEPEQWNTILVPTHGSLHNFGQRNNNGRIMAKINKTHWVESRIAIEYHSMKSLLLSPS